MHSQQQGRALSVSEFLGVVNRLVGGAEALVEGEVSGFSVSHGKWVFFSLKDQEQDALVECYMPFYQLQTQLADGMLARVAGRPSVHQRSGRFRIIVRAVAPVGEGALARALALLKAKLEKEGLFARERKRPIPFIPETIGLIASRESAAYSDFLKVLTHRLGGLKVLTRHVQVEGEAAISDIVAAFNEFAAHKPAPEVIVLTRGGGSLESLAAFNSEPVARAIFAAAVPVVVGVGHERDVTLADFVADVRASTPSNAAELLVQDRASLQANLTERIRRAQESISRLVSDEALLLESFERAGSGFVSTARERLAVLNRRSSQAFDYIWHWAVERLERAERLLKSFDPKAVLGRGYSIVYRGKQVVRSVKQVASGDSLAITVGDGKLDAQAK